MAFEVTTSVRKMLALKGSAKVIQGATSSGKTYGIIPILYDRALAKPNTLITVVAETIPSLKDGCVKIFQDFLFEQGRWRDDRWLGNPMQYTLPNRSKIQFKSFDSEGKAKASGKRDILFINEANHVPFPIADALIIRTTQECWFDFNADSEFWAHTEVLPRPNTDFLKLTYLDNESIPEGTLVQMLERKAKADAEEASGKKGYWWNWWQVYGLGEIGSLQGSIFNNWRICDEIPAHARLVGYGLDYGFVNDQTALTAIYYADNNYYLDELIYKTRLLNRGISAEMSRLGVDRYATITADSAEMKSNEELRGEGWRIVDAKKGSDSVMYGISRMQELNLQVTKRSLNLINEFRNYVWLVDKNGLSMNKPIDKYNHGIDGIRYHFQTNVSNPDAPRFHI